MPLSDAAPREAKHHRRIALDGYARADGLYDIEAHITDAKTYAFSNTDRGEIVPGAFLHEMWVRVTVDAALVVVGAEACTEHGPYAICPGGAASFPALAGLTIGPGFLRAARERLGGTRGCTHIHELLQQVATVAMQTVLPLRARKAPQPAAASVHSDAEPSIRMQAAADPAARLVDTCFAYARDGAVVRRRWPALAIDADATEPESVEPEAVSPRS